MEAKAIRAEEAASEVSLVARGTRVEETMGGQATTITTNQVTTEGEAMVAKEEASSVD